MMCSFTRPADIMSMLTILTYSHQRNHDDQHHDDVIAHIMQINTLPPKLPGPTYADQALECQQLSSREWPGWKPNKRLAVTFCERATSLHRSPAKPSASQLSRAPSSFPSRLCHFCSSHLLLLTLIRGGSSLWSNPSCVPVITKILPRKSSTHKLTTSVEIMSRSTSHCDAHNYAHLCPLPRSDDYWARQATAEPAVAVAATECGSLGASTYLEHILTRVFFHTRGPPGTKSDKVPLFPEHPTCHPWGPPCFREPFFFHQSSKEKLRFSDSLLAPLLFRTEMKIGQPQAYLDEEFHGRAVLFGLKPLFLALKIGRPNLKKNSYIHRTVLNKTIFLNPLTTSIGKHEFTNISDSYKF